MGKRKPQSDTDPGAQLSYPIGSGCMDTDDLICAAIAAANAADFVQAEKLCQKLLNEFPYAYDGHECLAYLRASQGHHEEASAHYEKALEKATKHPERTSVRLISYLEAELDLQRQIRDSKSMIEDMDRIERDMPANKEKMLPLLSWRWSSDKALKGLPLDLSVHLLRSFGLTIPPELAELRRRQMLAIGSIQDSDAAISKARVAREHLQEIITKCAKISQKNFALRGGSPGSLDGEVAAVLAEYESKSEPVTIDEVVGVAVARIYARLRLTQHSSAGYECLRIVTRGRFALMETGNCAVDCVFDPRLRAALSLRARARGGSLGDLLAVEKAYGEVSSIDPGGGVVRSVLLKDPARLKLLPEHVLHSVVLAYNSGSGGHAVRIAALEDNGIWAMEGNYDGALRVGRFVPFSELTTASGQIVLLHRRPLDRYGLFSSVPDDLSTDTEILTALEGVIAKTGQTEIFTVKEARIRRFVENPAMWHQMASIVRTLPVLRMRTVTAYAMVRQEDVVAEVPFLGGHKAEEVVERWLDYAANNPTGLLVTFGPPEIGKSLGGRSRLSESVMREIGAPQDPEGRHYLPLDTVTEIARKHDSRKYEFGLVHGLTRQQFVDLNEELKNRTWILTPLTADEGNPVVVKRCWELHEMNILADQPGVLAPAGAGSESVSIFDLLSNPLRSLVIFGLRIFLQPFVGTECEVSSADRDVINSVGIFLRDRSD